MYGKLLRMEPLDAIDRRIVAELRHDGRITINELAERVGLSGSPTLRRLRRLEADGVIRGYRADVDPQTIGRGFSVWVTARLAVGDPDAQKAFEDGLRSLAAVTEAHHVTGDVDYLVRVDVEDLAAYDHVIRNELATLPGQAHITSYVVTSTAIPPR
jgi:Lrp/AsnC family transcriptional regulator, leucine-responsive regulatory protein